ncbi:MAG: hypothetical protein ACXWB9_00800 [Flavisolibacter sp.]
MEDLFTTHIIIENEQVNFRVMFDQEKYVFLSEGNPKTFSSFALKREHDEWHDEQDLDPQVKDQAVEVLDKYLLRQH